MDDLEITLLCARAAGIRVDIRYMPLHNRDQALELVERLRLDIVSCNDGDWFVHTMKPRHEARDPNILRAICLCAARVQQAREAK